MAVLVAAQERELVTQILWYKVLLEAKEAFMQLEAVVRQVHLAEMDQPEPVRRTLCAETEAEADQLPRPDRLELAALAVVVAEAVAAARESTPLLTPEQAATVATAR